MILGIDPGKSGCYIVLTMDGEVVEGGGLPLIGGNYDVQEMHEIITRYDYKHLTCEEPGIIYGTSKSSVASLQNCIGLIEGMFVSTKTPYTMVKPKEWQKEMWKDVTKVMIPSTSGKTKVVDTKATSTMAAVRLFPTVDFKVTNIGNKSIKHNDGLIDAILIAEYTRRKIK